MLPRERRTGRRLNRAGVALFHGVQRVQREYRQSEAVVLNDGVLYQTSMAARANRTMRLVLG